MKARRLLQFLVLAGGGVVVVTLLSDNELRQRPEVSIASSGADIDQMRVTGRDGESIEVRLGAATFDMLEDVEVEPGVFETRETRHIHIASGEPGPDSTFLAADPHVEILDPLTGEKTGDITADQAVFLLEESVGGDVSVDLSKMQTRRIRLIGNVRGDMTSNEGLPVTIESDEMHVDGPVITATGLVTWTRPDATVVIAVV